MIQKYYIMQPFSSPVSFRENGSPRNWDELILDESSPTQTLEQSKSFIDVFRLDKARRSTDFEALELWKSRSGGRGGSDGGEGNDDDADDDDDDSRERKIDSDEAQTRPNVSPANASIYMTFM